ncbi:unnamed protein product [Peniophora sp. CBMAI 1063]|nr:unnamed protein product [Peniophora sp. CBMAI 1063]
MTVKRKTRNDGLGHPSAARGSENALESRRSTRLHNFLSRLVTVPLPIRTFARLQARTKPVDTSKQDISAWLSQSTATDPAAAEEMSDDEGSGAVEYVLSTEDWPLPLEHLTHALLSSSTASRVHFLRHDLLPLAQQADLSLSQTLDLFKALTLPSTHYADSSPPATEE